jgi:hypothetical protein
MTYSQAPLAAVEHALTARRAGPASTSPYGLAAWLADPLHRRTADLTRKTLFRKAAGQQVLEARFAVAHDRVQLFCTDDPAAAALPWFEDAPTNPERALFDLGAVFEDLMAQDGNAPCYASRVQVTAWGGAEVSLPHQLHSGARSLRFDPLLGFILDRSEVL